MKGIRKTHNTIMKNVYVLITYRIYLNTADLLGVSFVVYPVYVVSNF